jgi:hypothetical protein
MPWEFERLNKEERSRCMENYDMRSDQSRATEVALCEALEELHHFTREFKGQVSKSAFLSPSCASHELTIHDLENTLAS